MENKFLVELFVPSIGMKYNVYIPVNRRIGNVIVLLNKALFDLTNGEYIGTDNTIIYDRDTGLPYDINLLVRETNIKNGSGIVIL